ncbi:hypothetical protein BD310DRAFT_837388 [Dichomitus squalens]|uniref:Mid2 domain-containing protein n=1 Tax=Dichomitus squalens TaxID=114155 RepID=A0A4Q9QF25_9APHY|nr:hypothetical protein BD310DRAFT_837388 [Dichomitus squalens]
MVSPDQVLTTPPSSRTPVARRSPGNSAGLRDPQKPWQEFFTSVSTQCGTTLNCWSANIFPVVGTPHLYPHCFPINDACASSYISVVSVLYTSLHTDDIVVAPTSSADNSASPSSITATSTLHDPTPSSTPPGTSTNSPTSPVSSIQTTISSNDTISTTASSGGTDGAGASDSQSAPSIPASIVSTPYEDSSTTGPPAGTDSSSSAPGPSPSAVVHGGSPSSGLPGNVTASTPPKHPSASQSSPNAGAIAGGVIGGLLLIALLGALVFFIRRRRRMARIPPSAEFMYMTRGGAGGPEPAFVSFDPDGSATPAKLAPLARQSSIEDDERPPAFTPGSYSDPILEKVHASAAMRDQYGSGHEEGGFEAY